ncbi:MULTISPECIES: NUDIX domain-containing protein [Carnobacterium]|uniref:NUDIX hydrolase n=1 Tax=Carnobacterium TaxID=2747 RepID=UPI00191BB496|nr:NUDIX domain-containing protein [Carnobacterium maltaromaticum]CAD5897240.1 NUDIX domain protein [Carnobacterium maltaromaticum]
MELRSEDLTVQVGDFTFNHRAAGILIQEGAILLEYYEKEDYWVLPGGRVKVGEDSKIGVEREWLEELGLEVNGTRLIALIENFFVNHRTGSQRHFHEISMYYQLESSTKIPFQIGQKFHGAESDKLNYSWVPLTELVNLNFRPEILTNYLVNLPECPVHLINHE